ncbi:MAG: peptidoglycan DD-metalloendopeptidase family protein [Nitrospiraceae bacterium]|nr:peptidoglycan DD-metalloendopeptidase family protein [Nitrospiraceae bacterium]
MFLFLPLLLFLLLVPPPVTAAVNSHEEEYQRVQKKMAEQKKKLGEAQKRESSILGEIEGVNGNLDRIEAELRKYRKKMSETEAAIRTTTAEIEKIRGTLEKQKDWLKRKLRIMNRFGYSGDMLVLLLSAEDISQMMRTWKYLEQITLHEHQVLGDYRENLRDFTEKYEHLKTMKAELKTDAERIKAKENELADQKRAKETILSSVRKEKVSRQKMLAELKEASRRLLDLIERSSRTDTYTGPGIGFTRFKGKLPWPADGRIAVPYGSQRDPQYNTPVFRNGVQIETSANSDARAVHEGKVIFAEWFKGFGQLVIVNHGSGYHTLYGNLSEIFSHVGDIIKENQVIGKVGTSGMLNAPGLYFEIRYKGKPLDPAQWLRHRRG